MVIKKVMDHWTAPRPLHKYKEKLKHSRCQIFFKTAISPYIFVATTEVQTVFLLIVLLI